MVSKETSSERLAVAQDLGEYRLLKRLGSGGMGQVYKAMHRRLERLVAIKLLPSFLADDPLAVERFDREIKAAGRLNHVNVVQAHDAREINGTSFLVMEYVDGVDLSTLVGRVGPLPIADACELIRQASLGLQATYQHGLVHRDIKPANLMLSRLGQLKILDLGLARFRGGPNTDSDATGPGQTVGTAEYIAPEQVEDSRRIDIRADIYSLGCTFYKLLTGRPPYFGPRYRSVADKMAAHLREPAPAVRELRTDVPEPLAALVERMIAKDPADRFATPAAVAEAIVPYAMGCNLAELLRKNDEHAARAADGDDPSSTTSVAGRARTADNVTIEQAFDASEATVIRTSPARWAIVNVLASVLVLLALFGSVHLLDWTIAGRTLAGTALLDSEVASGVPGARLKLNQWTNLLDCLDLGRDRVSGTWTRESGALVGRADTGYPRIMLPAVISGDYQCRIDFVRREGGGTVAVVLPVSDTEVAEFFLGAAHGKECGFDNFQGKAMGRPGNPSIVMPEMILTDLLYRFTATVRRRGTGVDIQISLNDHLLVQQQVKYRSFTNCQECGIAEPQRVALGFEPGTKVEFREAFVRLIKGTGAIKESRSPEDCPPNQAIDLLARVDLARDQVGDNWLRHESDLVSQGEDMDDFLMLPVAVHGSYDLEIEFTQSPEDARISLILPIGEHRCAVDPMQHGELHPNPWEIFRPGPADVSATSELEGDRRHVLLAKVRADGGKAAVEIEVDGRTWIAWSGKETELHDGPIFLPEPDRIGYLTDGKQVLHHARFRLVSGRASLVRAAR